MTTEAASGPSSKSIIAGPHAQASVTLSLHPLVLVNISDHWTRTRAQNNGQPKQVFGAIIGKQVGRHLELMNSFELPYNVLNGQMVIDMEYFKTREAQYKEVFPDQEYLCWYNTGDLPTPDDIRMHNFYFSETNESPIFLKLNPELIPSEQLPIRLFESVIEIENGEANVQFLQISYTFVTEDSERIGIDHVARCSISSGSQTSHVTEHLNSQCGAVKMLAPRLRLISDYVKAVQAGELPKNDEILRQISSLCACLPVAQNEAFETEYNMQCNDIALLSYLGLLTKQTASLNKVVNKINVLYDHRGWGSRSRKGLMM